MNNDLLNAVKQIVAKEGEDILANPRRVSGFLSDLAKDVPKPAKNALVKCLEHKAVDALKNASKQDRANVKQKLAQRINGEEGLDPVLINETLSLLATVLFGADPFAGADGQGTPLAGQKTKTDVHAKPEAKAGSNTYKPSSGALPVADAEALYKQGNAAYEAKDYARANDFYRKAGDLGHPKAQNNLGWAYNHGEGVAQDYAKAAEWYRKAADQGHAPAQNNLAICYSNGEGVVQDHAKAVELYRKAADQGDAKAQCNLGHCYLVGDGVKKDFDKAFDLLRKAAAGGNKPAQETLNDLFPDGVP